MDEDERRSWLPRKLVALSLDHPKATLLLWFALCLIASPGVAMLQIETSTDSVLDRTGAEWAFYQSSQDRFGGDEVLTVLVLGERAYEPEALNAVLRLTDRFSAMPGVWRVDSLASVPLVQTSPVGDVLIEPALSAGVPEDVASLAELQRAVGSDRVAPRALVSADGTAFAVNVVLAQGAERFYETILSEVDSEIGGRVRWASGVPIFRTEADARTRRELSTFVPLTVALIGLLLFVAFRSGRAVIICLSVAGAGCWVTAGVMGAVGVPITIATVLLPSILLALGSSYSMHFLCAACGLQGTTLAPALAPIALPVALSGLTTAIGFLSIAAVRIDAIRDVGTYGALGVLVVLACTLSAVPALLGLFPIPRREHRLGLWLARRGPAALCRVVIARQGVLLAGWTVALMSVGVGIWSLRIETDVIEWFPHNDPIRLSYEEIKSRLSGISPMNVVIEAAPGRQATNADVVLAIDRLAAELEALPEVGKVISVADPLRQMHGGFLGDPTNPLPMEDSIIEQYLLLLESKPYTRDLVTSDRSAANLIMRVNDNGSDALLRIKDEVDQKWARYGPPGTEARTTGIMYEFGRAEDEIARGQLVGLSIAIGAIGIILLAIFRDVGLSLLALVPNTIPVIMAFGAMGLLGIPLDAGTVILGSLALGIAVDDTVHVTEGFIAGRDAGDDPVNALTRSLSRVLEPVVYTTLIVATGFAVLVVSEFTLTRNLGVLTSVVMVLCLAADLLLLPVLLVLSGYRPRRAKAH